MLAIHANEVVSRDLLIEELWPNDEFDAALNTLQVTVSRLRKALHSSAGDERLVTKPPGYLLRLGPDELDAGAFERLLEEGRAELAQGELEQALGHLQQALALWRGEALADFRYERFAQAAIARLEELRHICLEERVEAELALGCHDALVPELKALVHDHPLRERLRSQLMLALYRCGRQEEALELYRTTRNRRREELGLGPSPELQELQRQILQQEQALAAPKRIPTNLPAPPTPLVGRQRELEELEALLLNRDLRLLTLTGTGGTGKTRLALELAKNVLPHFERHGIWWLSLAPLADASLILPTLASALGLREGSPLPVLERLKSFLQERELLLVFDNFEHLLAAAPELAELLAAGPGIKALVTSRERLRLRGEQEYVVPALLDEDAVTLFSARAVEVGRNFEPSEEETIGQICARLDRLPLAIELAAARIRHLGPEALLARLEERLPLLSGGARDLPTRHQTLRDTIAWSYELLTAQERALFARFSIFAGGCTLEAAELVCEADLELLASLVEKSLLRSEPGAQGEPRFLMLETIREYAAELLAESGTADGVAAEHAHYFAALAERAEPELLEGDQARWLDILEPERDNLRGAMRWALARRDEELALRLATGSFRLWFLRVAGREATSWLEAALACDSGPATYRRALALSWAAILARNRGDFERALALAEEGLEAARDVDALRVQARCTYTLGVVAGYEGDLERARALLEEALALAQRAEAPRDVGFAFFHLGEVYLDQARYREAIESFTEAVDVLTNISHAEGLAYAHGWLGHALLLEGRDEEAALRLRECLAHASDLRYALPLSWAFEGLAALLALDGQLERAVRLIGAADGARERAGMAPRAANVLVRDRVLTPARERLGEDAVAALLREGHAIHFDDAVSYALEEARRNRPDAVTGTFLFSDIVGSTNLVDAIGDVAWQDLIDWHDRTLRALFHQHGGEEVDHAGDGFFVAFTAASSAIRCAVAIQQALDEHRRRHGFAPAVRIGVHSAEARTLGRGYRGKGIHVAARIGAAADANEVLASRETAEAAHLSLSNPRTVELKGLSAPIEVVPIDWAAV
jgi:predicted ATPase/class 3 adenylate cyclase